MGLVLKHVEQTKSGSWQYRRRVPKEVAALVSKREFKRKLGDSRKEALAAYSRCHAEVEREISEAKRLLARSATAIGCRGGLVSAAVAVFQGVALSIKPKGHDSISTGPGISDAGAVGKNRNASLALVGLGIAGD